jgi:hypothetical protein
LYTVNSPPARRFFFDDANVTLIPDSATVALVAVGAASLLVFRRR